MRKYRAFKTAVFAASALMFLSISKEVARADHLAAVEFGVAGISKTLNDVYSCGDNKVNEKITQLYNAKIYSPLSNLGVSKATNYVNVRSKPSTDSEVVGKLYNGCAAEILEWLEGDWVKIVSGDVEGYIASNYLATGKEAEKMADEHAEKYATVIDTPTLRVREEPSKEARTLELIPLGETFPVIKELDEWVLILLGTDDSGGRDFTGYVHKSYVNIEVIFKEAISIEEEQRIIRQQQEAERAEAERLQRLAEEKERKRIEEAKRQEEAKKAADKKKTEETTKEQPSNSSSSGSSSGKEISDYAQKFTGNPYVWGGTSLTKGADCSGFVYTIYKQFGYTVPRTSRDQAKSAGKKVDVGNRQPGDLIFYTNSSGVVNHVAIYIGNDKIVHAASSRQGIIISQYNYRKVYAVRRVVNQ